ncbi:MAG: FAD-binding oxidoreductase [Bacteriovorax sp.]|nr:FAD-binding oxidoreductase [Bacteriovorax sp.]
MVDQKIKSFYSNEELITHIKSGLPTLFHSSQTSTVIPFENIKGLLNPQTILGNLSTIEGHLEFTSNNDLFVSGFVTWKEAKDFCRSHGREIMTSPTEELAGVLAGIATSCTGERSFGFKNLRSQIVELHYLDYKGNENKLSADKKLLLPFDLTNYHNDFAPYLNFKNAPYPRLLVETDLMTGTEGQLGIITSAVLKTILYEEETYLFILLPKWEENFEPHLEIFHAVQAFRNEIRACEFIDSNSLSYLPAEKNPGKNQDIVFLEVRKSNFDTVHENLLAKLKLTNEENIFEMASGKCRDLRVSVPRAIFEVNSRMGVSKKGTDVQVSALKFRDLLTFYRSYTNRGVDYNLFGHFGDAHLHFNFMPTPDKNDFCNHELERLYNKVFEWHGSPFAEHGIGLLKKKFIAPFFTEHQKVVFRALKKEFDPRGQFFPEGFMS